jgi:hypothetical protein
MYAAGTTAFLDRANFLWVYRDAYVSTLFSVKENGSAPFLRSTPTGNLL